MALYGSVGVPSKPVETRLRRTVGHVFDHGLRPEPVELSDLHRHEGDLTLDSVLHPSDLLGSVLHPTTFFSSGWGFRALTPDELGITFGFPAWLRSGGLDFIDFPIVPVQIMDACLRSILAPQAFVSPLIPVPQVPVVADPEATWFPALQKFLPHAWIDKSTVSAKAAKGDDSAVPTSMWDQRVTLLYPWSPPQGVQVLACFRLYLMRSYRHRLLSDFRSFMEFTHGMYWPYRLMCARKRASELLQLRISSLRLADLARSGQGRKRQRGVMVM